MIVLTKNVIRKTIALHMGAWFLFFVNYAARVSGMPDMGFIAESVTMECLDCKEVHNIVTNYFNEKTMTEILENVLNVKEIIWFHGAKLIDMMNLIKIVMTVPNVVTKW